MQITDVQRASLDAWLQLYRTAGWWSPYEGVCIMSDRHRVIRFDDQRLLHCEDGPAVECGDGLRVYSWHGTRIPEEWITNRETLDPSIALTWGNVEQRRAAAEIIGWDRVLQQLETKTIDTDEDPEIGTLVECTLPDSDAPDRFLVVRCGTGRTLALRVPPDAGTALEANAWTYRVSVDVLKQLEVRT